MERGKLMGATDTLKHEHRVIELVLSGLERLAAQAEAGEAFSRRDAEKALKIVQNFADKCHHGKEEHHLFRMLEKRGMSREGGPLAVMLQEHEEGRAHVRAMQELLAKVEVEPQAAQSFAQHSRAYVELLRQHILKEDGVLYPMAERLLSAADNAELMKAFNAIEQDEMGAGAHEEYHRWAHELARGEA